MYDIFSLKDFYFPEGFLWGSATAGHQIEGDNVNSQFWEAEQKPEFTKAPGTAPSGKACNHYELYREDVNLIQSLGHQAYRMSIEWSRIEPAEGIWDNDAVNHYISLLSLLKERGIKIFLTLHHFTHPAWFAHLGGFSKTENIKYFERYLEFIVPKITGFVDSWNVFNEFNLGMGEEKFNTKMVTIRAHARGYHIIKKYSSAPVSTAHAFVVYDSKRKYDKFDNIMADYYDWAAHEFFLHAIRTGEVVMPFCDGFYDKDIKDTMDYWAINLYTRTMIDARCKSGTGTRYRHKALKMLPMDFYLQEIYPENMIHVLSRLHDKPIYITENGCSCYDDRFRIVYLTLYLNALKEAMDMGADVRGYLYWSLMDNYEWTSFIPRFGLVDVDFETFERTPRPSAAFYKEIIQNNGVSQKILRKYLTELPTLELSQKLFEEMK